MRQTTSGTHASFGADMQISGKSRSKIYPFRSSPTGEWLMRSYSRVAQSASFVLSPIWRTRNRNIQSIRDSQELRWPLYKAREVALTAREIGLGWLLWGCTSRCYYLCSWKALTQQKLRWRNQHQVVGVLSLQTKLSKQLWTLNVQKKKGVLYRFKSKTNIIGNQNQFLAVSAFLAGQITTPKVMMPSGDVWCRRITSLQEKTHCQHPASAEIWPKESHIVSRYVQMNFDARKVLKGVQRETFDPRGRTAFQERIYEFGSKNECTINVPLYPKGGSQKSADENKRYK